MNNSVQNKVAEYVKSHIHVEINKLTTKTLLFKEGLFDSMAFVLLIDFIEEHFGIKPTDEDLIEENFESIDAITKYIQNKKNIRN